ncbi:hypothetical protein EJ08DRAFT_650771 [Tothia fuscella]|uniref:Uncharacterized protein n=1 Tax=Tothia fuscella TaxID=1048955 RepID=A0A9P4TX98_9PEZI|nr:hypothetical protein EJ08DRAFT_650771 [Tothia fuscella]
MLHNRPGAEPKLLPRPDRSSNNLPNLPSWVPDYSVRTFFTKSNYPLLAFDKPFGNLEGGFVSTKDLYTLGIRGVKVDTIADVGESYNELKETSLICRSLALVKGLGATCSPICGSCGGRTFACTLITLFPGNAGPRVKEGFYNYLCFLKTTELRDNQSRLRLPLAAQKAHQEMAHLEQDWRPSVSEIVDCVLEFDKQKTYRSSGFVQAQAKASWYEDKLETFFDGRRFSITETGRMGIGPKSLAVGDEIWVIPRNDMVEVLRRNGPNSFVALGGAYVSDMMEGQTVSQMTDRDLIDITIV